IELPVLQNVPQCRRWAGQVGGKAGYHAPAPPIWTRRLDSVFLHPVLGPIVSVAVVVAVFQTIFSYAAPLQDWIKKLFDLTGGWVGAALPDSLLRSLLIEGVWQGVGSVIVFLPQVLLLFLF